MAKSIQLGAGRRGSGQTKKKSARAQAPYKSRGVNAISPSYRPLKAKRSGDKKAAYDAGRADMRPRMVPNREIDYTSAWMKAHGMVNPQNFGTKARLPFASVPADYIGAGASVLKSKLRGVRKPNRKAQPVVALRGKKTSSRKTKVTYTGKNFLNTRRPRIISARKTA